MSVSYSHCMLYYNMQIYSTLINIPFIPDFQIHFYLPVTLQSYTASIVQWTFSPNEHRSSQYQFQFALCCSWKTSLCNMSLKCAPSFRKDCAWDKNYPHVLQNCASKLCFPILVLTSWSTTEVHLGSGPSFLIILGCWWGNYCAITDRQNTSCRPSGIRPIRNSETNEVPCTPKLSRAELQAGIPSRFHPPNLPISFNTGPKYWLSTGFSHECIFHGITKLLMGLQDLDSIDLSLYFLKDIRRWIEL